MLLHTQLSVATRCPQCGQFDLHPLSLFQLSPGRSTAITCKCGCQKIHIGTRDRREYSMRVACILCEGVHFSYHHGGALSSGEIFHFYCPESDLEIGFMGPEQAVADHARCWEDASPGVDDEDFGNYFQNPPIMYRILDYLHELAEKGNLMCVCGHARIEMNVLPDRLELRCKACGQLEVVPAAREEDLSFLLAEGGGEPEADKHRLWPILSLLDARKKGR